MYFFSSVLYVCLILNRNKFLSYEGLDQVLNKLAIRNSGVGWYSQPRHSYTMKVYVGT